MSVLVKLPDEQELRRRLDRLSPEQRAEAEELLAAYYTQLEANPLLRFEPHPLQAEYLAIRTPIGAAFAGNRFGKTSISLVDGLIQLCDEDAIPDHLKQFKRWHEPIRARICAPKFNENIEQVIFPELKKWVPKNQLVGGGWDAAFSKQKRVLNFANGSTVQFLCFRGDQRALLPDGTWREIQDLGVGEEVQTRFGPRKIVRAVAYPDAPLMRVRATGGHEIVATPNHPHLRADGEWKRTDELRVGDVLETRRDCGPGEPILEAWEIGWLAVMIGDGCITGSCLTPSATIAEGSPLRDELPPAPPDCHLRWNEPEDRTATLFVATDKNKGNPLKALLERFGLWGCGSHTKFIPDEIFRLWKDGRGRFLRYLWATDGTWDLKRRQATYTTVSRRLAYDVKYLLWSIGITAAVCEFTAPASGFSKRDRTMYHVDVYGDFDKFAFLVGRAGEPRSEVERGLGCRPPGRVRSIEVVDNAPVYCVEVEEVNELIVDGIVTSNTYDQDVDAHAGGSLHWILFDEEPEGDKGLTLYRENQTRLGDTNGDFRMAMTPLFGLSWAYDEIYKARLSDSDVTVIQGSTYENPYVSHERLEKDAAKMSREERQARREGKFVHFAGQFYPEFGEDQLVAPPKPADLKEQSIIVGIDPGLNYTGVVWVAFDNDNVALVFAELKPEQQVPEDIAKLIHAVNKTWDVDPDYYVIDPSARNRATVNRQKVEDAYLKAGIATVHGQNDRAAGILEIKARLQHEGLLVSRNCPLIADEFEHYRKDPNSNDEFAAVKANDHLLDGIRYVAMERLWTPVGETVPEPERDEWQPGTAPPAEWFDQEPEGLLI